MAGSRHRSGGQPAGEIASGMALLAENLWWSGLTLRDKELTARLPSGQVIDRPLY